MKLRAAIDIIAGTGRGYAVSFDRLHADGKYYGDNFPDVLAGEQPIKSEEAAWELATLFARKTVGKCVNIYVVKEDFTPVERYKELEISNRGPQEAERPVTQVVHEGRGR